MQKRKGERETEKTGRQRLKSCYFTEISMKLQVQCSLKDQVLKALQSVYSKITACYCLHTLHKGLMGEIHICQDNTNKTVTSLEDRTISPRMT